MCGTHVSIISSYFRVWGIGGGVKTKKNAWWGTSFLQVGGLKFPDPFVFRRKVHGGFDRWTTQVMHGAALGGGEEATAVAPKAQRLMQGSKLGGLSSEGAAHVSMMCRVL